MLKNNLVFVPELDFVIHMNGELDRMSIFMRTAIAADDGRSIPIMPMESICIQDKYKRKRYGKILRDYLLENAAELGCGAFCYEGNTDFYDKNGFIQASEYGIRYHGLTEGEDVSFFLCRELLLWYFNGIIG